MSLSEVNGQKSMGERVLRLERLIDGRLGPENLDISRVFGGSIIKGPDGFVARKEQKLVLVWDYKFPRVVRSCRRDDGEYDYCIVVKQGHKFILVNEADTQGEACVEAGSLEVTVQDNVEILAPSGNIDLQTDGEVQYNGSEIAVVDDIPTTVAELTDEGNYTRVDGSRAFTGVVGGVTPTAAAHLTRKDYVDAADDAHQAAAEAAAEVNTAAAIATHEAASDPHPGYLTHAEGNAAYDAIGAAAAAQAAAEATAAAALTAHHDASSADHDDRYYTETEVDNLDDSHQAAAEATAAAALAAHVAAGDPHPGYALESELGSMAAQDNDSVNIDGGTIDGTVITLETSLTPGLAQPHWNSTLLTLVWGDA